MPHVYYQTDFTLAREDDMKQGAARLQPHHSACKSFLRCNIDPSKVVRLRRLCRCLPQNWNMLNYLTETFCVTNLRRPTVCGGTFWPGPFRCQGAEEVNSWTHVDTQYPAPTRSDTRYDPHISAYILLQSILLCFVFKSKLYLDFNLFQHDADA